VGNISLIQVLLSLLACICAVRVLFAKTPLAAALSLLGVLLSTGFMYGLMNEHFIATIQLVVYAGAIMVLFIFSIMLLNLKSEGSDLSWKNPVTVAGIGLCGFLFYAVAKAITQEFMSGRPRKIGFFTEANVAALGGNSKVLAHALFSQFYISFEVISLALLTALVAAVVLAKRKFD
jgi:NADH-quinone oxidoreductase subunit J